jgi:hypothetical protein
MRRRAAGVYISGVMERGRVRVAAAIVALASAALMVSAAIGMILTVHFAIPDLPRALPAGIGLLLAAILPLAAGVGLANSRHKDATAQRRSLVLARVLLGLGIVVTIVAGLVTAFAVGFTLADSPPFDRRGLDVTDALTNVAFYGALATDVLALLVTLLIRQPRTRTI